MSLNKFKPMLLFQFLGSLFEYVPKHAKTTLRDVTILQNFINENNKLVVLTGAGISTESGLPDYRSKGVGLYDRNLNRPVQFQDYITKPHVRSRYWARNFAAWKFFSSSLPNATHIALADWEKRGFVDSIITQNVDRLHHKAGSQRVVELHGTSYLVQCMVCGERTPRFKLQERLEKANPSFQRERVLCGEMRPDADLDLDPSLVESFNVVNCETCDGMLKPYVVFFGENVSKDMVYDVYKRIENSSAILVLGSSLEVYSGYRFVLHAFEHGKPIGIVNIGQTRADSLATFKISTRCGELLPKVIC